MRHSVAPSDHRKFREHVKNRSPDTWKFNGPTIRKDGYEVYLTGNGFELTMRNPETTEREVLFTVEQHDPYSPHLLGALLYVLCNVETVARQAKDLSRWRDNM